MSWQSQSRFIFINNHSTPEDYTKVLSWLLDKAFTMKWSVALGIAAGNHTLALQDLPDGRKQIELIIRDDPDLATQFKLAF